MIADQKSNPGFNIFLWLPILALGVDLFTPYLIWKGFLPAELRWLSHAAVALMIFVTVIRMLSFNCIPRAFWVIVSVTVLWSYVAVGHGQGVAPTIWGVWLLFQFPIVALFMYLQPDLPPQFPRYVRNSGLIILGMQVFAQTLQYAFGVTPGDDLSGLFGKNGTGNAILFDVLVCCIFFGYWLTTKKWTGLLAALCLSMISSVLGEMKIFAAVIVTIGLVAVFLYAIKYHAPGKMMVYLTLILVVLVGFIFMYNAIIPGADKTPIQTFVTNPSRLLKYLKLTSSSNKDGNVLSYLGRMDALEIGWNSIKNEPVTLLFGYGLGTRSESQTLGTTGVALTTGNLGLAVGTSLLVIMQEMGLLGVTLLIAFLGWVISRLAHDIRAYPQSRAGAIRYGLLFFSMLWPVWLWYATTWTARAPMTVYWMLLGYVLAEIRIAPNLAKAKKS